MGCGLISQRGPAIEVHHPLGPTPGTRAIGARVVQHGSAAGAGEQRLPERADREQQRAERAERQAAASSSGARGDEARRPARGGGHEEGPVAGQGRGRRVVVGERVVLASRLPGFAQDHAFCFECGSFFQLCPQRSAACSRCSSSFVQFLRGQGGENWLSAESALGNSGHTFTFDDQLDTSLNESMDNTPMTRRPTQGGALKALPALRLSEAEAAAREGLEDADPRRSCAVCREGFVVGNTLRSLPCCHEFHDSCILPWLESSNTCPICRWKLPEAKEEDDDAVDEAPAFRQVPAAKRRGASERSHGDEARWSGAARPHAADPVVPMDRPSVSSS